MMQPSAHSDAHITPRSAQTPDAHTSDASPAKSDSSGIMSDRRSKKEQRETSRSEDDVVITEHRSGKRKDDDDAGPNKEVQFLRPKDLYRSINKRRYWYLKSVIKLKAEMKNLFNLVKAGFCTISEQNIIFEVDTTIKEVEMRLDVVRTANLKRLTGPVATKKLHADYELLEVKKGLYSCRMTLKQISFLKLGAKLKAKAKDPALQF